MVVYVGIFILLALAAYYITEKKDQEVGLLVAVSALIIFVGTRLNTGCDFTGYGFRFEYFDTLIPIKTLLASDESGFLLLTHIIKASGLGYMWLNIAAALLCFYGFVRFARCHHQPLLVLALCFPILIVQLFMSGIRQAIAVAFLMLACKAFIEQKRLWVAAMIVLGATFHQTVILFLPMAFLPGRHISTPKILAGVLLLAPFSALFISDRLEVYQDRYIEQIYGSQESAGAWLRLGLLVLTAAIFEYYKEPMQKLFPRSFSLMRLFSLMAFALIPVALISSVAVHRLGYYILPVQIFTLAALPFAMFSEPAKQLQARVWPLLLYAAYIVVWFGLSRHATYCYVPYDSYMFN